MNDVFAADPVDESLGLSPSEISVLHGIFSYRLFADGFLLPASQSHNCHSHSYKTPIVFRIL